MHVEPIWIHSRLFVRKEHPCHACFLQALTGTTIRLVPRPLPLLHEPTSRHTPLPISASRRHFTRWNHCTLPSTLPPHITRITSCESPLPGTFIRRLSRRTRPRTTAVHFCRCCTRLLWLLESPSLSRARTPARPSYLALLRTETPVPLTGTAPMSSNVRSERLRVTDAGSPARYLDMAGARHMSACTPSSHAWMEPTRPDRPSFRPILC